MKILDLHGVRHKDAQSAVRKFIKATKSIRPVEIITGNSTEMQRLTIEMINTYGLKYEFKDYYNLGSFIIFD